jgi:hypothetical protein
MAADQSVFKRHFFPVSMSSTIQVTLLGCAGLLGKQDNGFSDPVVHLNCCGKVLVSTVQQATNSPVWNEAFSWEVPSASRGIPLTLHVWNSPKFALGPDTKGAFLGTATIEDVLQFIGKATTLVLQKRSSRSNVSGSISVRIDDEASKAAQASNSAAPPSSSAVSHSDATGSKSVRIPDSSDVDDGRVGRSSACKLSSEDAALLDGFVSKAGNEQCADCDSKQVCDLSCRIFDFVLRCIRIFICSAPFP